MSHTEVRDLMTNIGSGTVIGAFTHANPLLPIAHRKHLPIGGPKTGMGTVCRIDSGAHIRVEFALYGQTITVYAGGGQDDAACTPQFIAA